MKRILMVISTLNFGGAQRAFANMSLSLSDEYEIDFLLNDTNNISYDYKGNILDLQMKEPADRTGLLYQAQVFIKRYAKLKKLKRTGRYNACISALSSANAVNVLTGNRYCKTIISIRSFMSKRVGKSLNIKKLIEYWSIRFFSNLADNVVSISESMRMDMIQNFGVDESKAVTIYNGYNLWNIQELSKESLSEQEKVWIDGAAKVVVTVGRLEEVKGHEHLIRAFGYIKERNPGTRLLILGEGKQRTALEKQIAEQGLEQDVYLCGFVKNPYKIVQKSDLFVLSSRYEGFPNALAESLCLGVPVISTDCDSGAREILAPGTDLKQKVTKGFEKAEYGILCPVCESVSSCVEETTLTEEEKDMAEAILSMLQDEKTYTHYREKCRERAEQLSMEKVVGSWAALIG